MQVDPSTGRKRATADRRNPPGTKRPFAAIVSYRLTRTK